MKIRVTNYSNASIVHHPVVIIKGCVENYPAEVWRKYSRSSFLMMIHTQGEQDSNANEAQKLITEVPLIKLKFKIVCQLYKGENDIKFDFLGVKDTLKIWYREPVTEYLVRLVYVTCKDDDGSFQSPSDLDNSVRAAVKKISVCSTVLQCVMGELLWEQKMGRRTFALETDRDGQPVVHIHQSGLTVEETHALGQERLWELLAREIISSKIGDKKVKYLSFLSSTRYQNTKRIKPFSHSHTLAMTKGHIALGGGGLALFGTGCLWTWPDTIACVQSRLLDSSPIDSKFYMDDSAYRGTVGGCMATTLGSVLHELGHTLDLGHTDQGIMSRGFDDLDSFLTLASEKAGRNIPKGKLQPCGSCSRDASPTAIQRSNSLSSREELGGSPRFTNVRRSDSVSKYLEEYSEKRMERNSGEMRDGGGCFWTRSCALILSHQLWIRSGADLVVPCGGELVLSMQKVAACCRVMVVELRGDKGMVRNYWEPEQPCTLVELEKEVMGQVRLSKDEWQLVAMAECGKIRTIKLTKDGGATNN